MNSESEQSEINADSARNLEGESEEAPDKDDGSGQLELFDDQKEECKQVPNLVEVLDISKNSSNEQALLMCSENIDDRFGGRQSLAFYGEAGLQTKKKVIGLIGRVGQAIDNVLVQRGAAEPIKSATYIAKNEEFDKLMQNATLNKEKQS